MRRIGKLWVYTLIGIWGVPFSTFSQGNGDQEMRVVLFGDSMTEGWGVDSTRSFGSLLETELKQTGIPVAVLNAGKGPDRSDMAIARMQQDVIVKQPDVVLIMYGAYDAMVDSGKTKARIPLNVYTKQITQIISFLKGINVTPILMTAPSMGMTPAMDREPYKSAGPNFLLTHYMEACRKLAKESRIPLVDHFSTWEKLAEEGKDLSALRLDGFHPNVAGHKQMAESIFPVLKEELSPKFMEVYSKEDVPYDQYKSPAILTSRSGFLLAFAEGIRNQTGINSSDIVFKRSFNKGESWTELDTLVSGGLSFLSDPVAAQEESSGKIYLLYQSRPGFSEGEGDALEAGVKGDLIAKVFYLMTEDEGRNWSEPVEITKDVKRPKEVTHISGGPSNGVFISDEKGPGRMVLPFCQKANGQWQVFTVYSDNSGKSWKYSDLIAGAEQQQLSEPTLIQQTGDTLLLSVRSNKEKKRLLATTENGGKTWTPFSEDPNYPTSSTKPTSLFKFNPYYTLYVGIEEGKDEGIMKLSKDQGKSWKYRQVFYSGKFGEGSFTTSGPTQAGILFSYGENEGINYARFPIKWLLVNPIED
ncbi:MAG: exo-alpha-sialidase [Bacteroidota bacterium]